GSRCRRTHGAAVVAPDERDGADGRSPDRDRPRADPRRRRARRRDRGNRRGFSRGRLPRPHVGRGRIPLDDHDRNRITEMTTAQNARKRTTYVPGPDGLAFRGILRSEFIKLTSLRSSIALLLAIPALGVGVSAALSLTMADAGVPDQPSVGFMLDQVTLGTVLFGQLIAAVLGVLVISGEYSSGTLQPTLIAAPARLPVLEAKALVLFTMTTVSALIATF